MPICNLGGLLIGSLASARGRHRSIGVRTGSMSAVARCYPAQEVPMTRALIAVAVMAVSAATLSAADKVRIPGDYVEARTAEVFEIGRAHVCTTVTNAQLVCRL